MVDKKSEEDQFESRRQEGREREDFVMIFVRVVPTMYHWQQFDIKIECYLEWL